jgi:hypothetical protein
MKRIAVALLVLFALFCAGCGGPTHSVRQYIKKSMEGDIPGAKSYCTGEMLKMIESVEELMVQTGVDISQIDMSEFGLDWKTVKSEIDISLEEKTGNSAKVRVEAEGVAVMYNLVRVGGKWKISNITMPGIKNVTDLMKGLR